MGIAVVRQLHVVDRVGHERANAVAEVRRHVRRPLVIERVDAERFEVLLRQAYEGGSSATMDAMGGLEEETDLADLAQKAGRKQEAVQWLARAYAGAKGPATRFQWGYNYLVGLLEMTPEDTQAIERAGLAVLGELDGSPDAFYQRTRMRLEQLDELRKRIMPFAEARGYLTDEDIFSDIS